MPGRIRNSEERVRVRPELGVRKEDNSSCVLCVSVVRLTDWLTG